MAPARKWKRACYSKYTSSVRTSIHGILDNITSHSRRLAEFVVQTFNDDVHRAYGGVDYNLVEFIHSVVRVSYEIKTCGFGTVIINAKPLLGLYFFE